MRRHSLIATGLAIPMLAGIFLNYLYCDELIYNWIFYSYNPTDGVRNFVFPACSNSFEMTVPATLVPGAYILKLLSSLTDSFLLIRLQGIGLFLLLCFLIHRIATNLQGSVVPLGVSLGPLILGTLPFIGSMTRPEQLVAIGTSLLVLVATQHLSTPSLGWQRLTSLLTVLLTSSTMLAAHPAALLSCGVYIVAALSIFKNKTTKIILAGTLLIACMQGYNFHAPTTECSGSQHIDEFLRQYSKIPGSIYEILPRLWGNFEIALGALLVSSAYTFTANLVLTPSPAAYPITIAIDSLITLGVALFLFSLGAALFHYFRRPFAASLYAGLVLSLIAALAGTIMIQPKIFAYRSPLVWTYFVLIAALVSAGFSSLPLYRMLARVRSWIAIASIIVVPCLLLPESKIHTLKQFSDQSKTGYGFIWAWENERAFSSEFNLKQTEWNFQENSSAQKIEKRHWVVDELVYLKTRASIPTVLARYTGLPGAEPISLNQNLKTLNLDGIIKLCSDVSSEIRQRSIHLEPFCLYQRLSSK